MLHLVASLALTGVSLAGAQQLQIELPTATVRYGTERATPPEQLELAAQVHARWPDLTWAPGLVDAARAWAIATADLGAVELPPSFTEAVLLRTGNPEPTAVASAVDASPLHVVLEHVAAVIKASPDPLTHVGLARIDSAGGHRWGLILSQRAVRVESFPVLLEVGAAARLGFRLEKGFDDPRVAIIADGETLEVPVRSIEDGWVAVVRAPARPGVAWVMVIATTPKGDALVAQLEVGVGRQPPPAWRGNPIQAEDPDADLESVEALMVEFINHDRGRHGLPSLVSDSELAAVARAHSRDMRDNRFFDHRSPTHGELTERLAAAGYPAAVARENLARAPTVHAAQSALMASLTHRANVLASDVTAVGVGVVRDQGLGAQPAFLTTQAFTAKVAPRSAEELSWLILRKLSLWRGDAGARVLQSDEDLDRRAIEFMGTGELATFSGRSTSDQPCDVPRTWRHIRALTLEFNSVSDVRFPEWVTDLTLTHYGIAIAQRVGGHWPHSKVALLMARPWEAPTEDGIWQRFEEARADHHLPPLVRLGILDREARRLAEISIDTEFPGAADTNRLRRELAAVGVTAGEFVTVVVSGPDKQLLANPRQVIDPSISAIGLGIAHRDPGDCAANYTAVLLFLRDPKGVRWMKNQEIRP